MMLSILLVACGDNDEVQNPPQNTNDNGGENEPAEDNETTTNEESGTDVTDNADNGATDKGTTTDTGYSFYAFDLEADYPDNKDALDVDYDNEPNDKMEASYRDQSQGIDLRGDEAMNELDSIFSSFDFDENTPNEEVLDAVIEAFNIPEDATNIELDIDFNNGTEKEYRR